MNEPDLQSDRSVGHRGRSADLIACAVISVIYVVISAFVGVQGEFPLNDDWAYAETTRGLMETGQLERSSWTWVPMITHAVVGSAFSSLFGFSFESLRLSSVFMGWLGVLGAYALCRQVGVRVPAACLGAAVVGLNPMHVNLSHSFMMDVPFATITTWSLVCLCRGLKQRSWAWICLGVVLAEGAVLNRQPGLAIPLALVIVLVAIGPRSSRHLLAAAMIAGVTVVAHFLLPDLIYGPRDSGRMLGFSYLVDQALPSPAFTWNVVTNSLAQISYLGLFLAPVVLGVAMSRAASIWVLTASAVLAGLSVAAILALGLEVPLGLNLIYDFGLGPVTLLGAEQMPSVGDGVWWTLTVLGTLASFVAIGAILTAVWNRRRELGKWSHGILLGLVPVIYLPPLLVRSPCFDRYLLPLLPPLAALLLMLDRSSRRMWFSGRNLGVAMLVVMGVYGVLGTRDYLEHHRARWTLLDELIEGGTDPEDIHGGFEFKCRHGDENLRPDSWADMNGQRYVLSLASELEGHRPVKSLSYTRLLPPGNQVITVFESEK